MKTTFYLTGILLIVFGIAVAWDTISTWTSKWLACAAIAIIELSGVVLVIAGARRYRGGWMSLIGALLLSVSILGLMVEADDYLGSNSEDASFGIGLAAVLFIIGMLLLIFGHRRHTCYLQKEGEA
jgi:hypothetical protein